MLVVGNEGIVAADEPRLADVTFYCVRVDHVTGPAAQPPTLTMHERSWAYCKSGSKDDQHYWAPTRGVALTELYPDRALPRADVSGFAWVDELRGRIMARLTCNACVFEIARVPTPLRISFDEALPGTEPLRVIVAVDFADHLGSVGRVTVARPAPAWTPEETTLLRSVVAPFVSGIRAWLRNTAGVS
jgi:hypothetical protein